MMPQVPEMAPVFLSAKLLPEYVVKQVLTRSILDLPTWEKEK